NCDQAVVSVSVTAAAIVANDDTAAPINGYVGGTAYTNVLSNDTLNGAPVIPSQVNTTFVSSTNTGITLSGTNVLVAPGTPAGSYTLTYQICEVLNPSNCDQATVYITVQAAVIDAVNDTAAPINGYVGGTAYTNVLSNDTLNGAPVIPSQVNTTFVSSTNAGITLSGTDVIVAPGTPAGSYTLTYQICEILNPSNCDQAIVSVSVAAAVIDAVNDTAAPINGFVGGTAYTNVLSNDTLNGAPVIPSEVNTTFVSSTNAGITLSGIDVIVAPGTPAGSYTLTYQICEVLNPTNCDQAVVSVSVAAAAIVAVNDTYSVDCANIGTIGNILTNDSLNNANVSISQVNLSIINGSYPNLNIDANGNVSLTSIGHCGDYTFTYQICEKLNPDNCDTATATITIIDNTPPTWTTTAGSLDITLECSDTSGLDAAQAQFPVAVDNCDSDVTNVVKNAGQFVAIPTCPNAGTYTNTWTVKDACNNVSATYTQTITIEDTTAPTWSTAAGSLDTTVQCSDAAALAVAQALAPIAVDNCLGTITYTKTSGQFDAVQGCSNAGTYTNTWTANDVCNNVSTVFTQVITVQDTVAPIWETANGTLNTTVECGDKDALDSAQGLIPVASDLCDADVTNIIKKDGNFIPTIGCANTGTYTNEWTVLDDCGNGSAVFTQIITVVDTTAPTIDTPAANATVQCDGQGNTEALQAWLSSNGGATASDSCSNVTWSNNFSTLSDDCGNTGTATVTFTATDGCGNATSTSATFTIEDTTAPTIDTAAANATVQCDGQGNTEALQAWLSSNGGATASDVCSNVTWTNSFDALSDGCGNTGSATVTFTATDDCGNATTTS
ncbi:hypothetical protein L1S35_13155, partial [Flavobacterium sp. AS60]|nr:hypothetical protein [Flavobacterium sp. AS60]